jgi:hypothetical protein
MALGSSASWSTGRSLLVAIGLVTAATGGSACSILTGADGFEEVQCVDACDAGTDGASSSADAAIPTGDAALAGDGPRPTAEGGAADSSPVATDAGAQDGSTAADSSEAAGPTSAYRAAVLADSPLGYWRLGDSDSSTTCADETGHGHAGSIIGGVILGVAGALESDANTAASFDGTTASIDLGSSFAFAGSSAYSWEVWVKPAILDATDRAFMTAMMLDGVGAPSTGTYMLAYASSGNTFGFERYDGGSTVNAIETTGLSVGAWTYVVATTDASGDSIVYMNGTAVLSATAHGTIEGYAMDTVLGGYFKGDLDEVAIYDHVLTAGAVLAHWQAGSQ